MELEPILEALTRIKGYVKAGARKGTITCPKCGGWIYWRTAGKKNHVHARCETEGCIQFME